MACVMAFGCTMPCLTPSRMLPATMPRRAGPWTKPSASGGRPFGPTTANQASTT